MPPPWRRSCPCSPSTKWPREVKKDRTIVQPGGTLGATVGGKKVCIIAGPCSVESREQLLLCAKRSQRGRAPPPSAAEPSNPAPLCPYEFRGLGERAASKSSPKPAIKPGWPSSPKSWPSTRWQLVCKYADMFQVSAREHAELQPASWPSANRKSPSSSNAASRATLDEFLLAGEYIMSRGNPNVILCERGIRTFETYCRNTLAAGDCAGSPPHLPSAHRGGSQPGHRPRPPRPRHVQSRHRRWGRRPHHRSPRRPRTRSHRCSAQSITPKTWWKR